MRILYFYQNKISYQIYIEVYKNKKKKVLLFVNFFTKSIQNLKIKERYLFIEIGLLQLFIFLCYILYTYITI